MSRKSFVRLLMVCCFCCSSASEQVLENLYVTARSGLSLRTEPAQESQRLLLMPYEARVELLAPDSGPHATIDGKSSEWLRVRFNGQTGWAFGGYLSEIPPELRARQTRGQDCSVDEAKFASTSRRAISVQPFVSGAPTRVPCIINDQPRVLPEDDFYREVHISQTGEWAIALARTDAFGDAYVLNLRSNQVLARLRYSNFAVIDGDSAYIWVPLTCKQMQKKRFSNGRFTEVGIETQTDDCHI